MQTKLSGKDKLIILFTSVVLAAFTLYYATGSYYDGVNPGIAYQIVTSILQFPILVITVPSLIISDNLLFAFGVLLFIIMPFISLVFWYLVFFCCAKAVRRFFKTSNPLLVNICPIAFGIAFVITFIVSVNTH